MVKRIAYWTIGLGGAIYLAGLWMICKGQVLFEWTREIDEQRLAALGSFVDGTVGSLWGLASILLILETIRLQNRQLMDAEMAKREERFLVYLEKLEGFIDRLHVVDGRLPGRQVMNGHDVIRVWSDFFEEATRQQAEISSVGEAVQKGMAKYRASMLNFTDGVGRLLTYATSAHNSPEAKEGMLSALCHSLTATEFRVFLYTTRFTEDRYYRLFTAELASRIDRDDLLYSEKHAWLLP